MTTHTHTNALTCGLATGGPDLAHAEAGWLVGISSGGERGSTVAEPGTRCSANDRHRRSDMGGEQMSDPEPTVLMASGFKAGQSDGGIGYEDEVAPTLNAAMSSLEPTVLAFSAGNSADAHGIGLTVEGTPPLRAAASGSNQVPTVLAFGHTQGLDLQVSSEATPTLRSKGDGAAVSTTAHVRRLTPLECEQIGRAHV